jgi:hypothetical protein
MFSAYARIPVNILSYSNLEYENGIKKNTIKCSDFQYANYTFVDSF